MKEMNLAILPGDGVGNEIISQAVKVVNAISEKFNHKVNYRYGLIGASAIDKVGVPYPDETHNICIESDAVLFGAIGDPKYDNNPNAKVRPEQGLLEMRKRLGLYANIRPIETFEALIHKSPLKEEVVRDVDFLCVRELTGGIYFGEKGRTNNGTVAYDTNLYSKTEVERILKLSFDYARKRNNRVTLVDKANVLESSRLWRETAQELSVENPDIQIEYMFVDNAAMQIIQWPGKFDVIVTENMFGDILTDEASVITGSLGLLPSASIGEFTSVFEPIHGSYPQATGKNIANPLGTILSVALMYEYVFSLKTEANLVREAVVKSIECGVVTEDLSSEKSFGTSEVGDWIKQYILKKNTMDE